MADSYSAAISATFASTGFLGATGISEGLRTSWGGSSVSYRQTFRGVTTVSTFATITSASLMFFHPHATNRQSWRLADSSAEVGILIASQGICAFRSPLGNPFAYTTVAGSTVELIIHSFL